jgi:hypothetical protein
MRLSRLGLWTAAAWLVAVPVQAITVHDLIELTRAGVPEAVLVQLDTGQPAPDAADIAALHEAGVAEAVMLAFVRNAARPPRQVGAALEAEADPGGARHRGHARPFYVPVYVTVPSGAAHPRTPAHPEPPVRPRAPTLDEQPGFGRFMNTGWRPGPPSSVWDIGRWQSPPP